MTPEHLLQVRSRAVQHIGQVGAQLVLSHVGGRSRAELLG